MLQKQREAEMVMEARRAMPAQTPDGVRLVPFNGRERDLAGLDEALTRGSGHDDLRDWLQLVDAAGELRARRRDAPPHRWGAGRALRPHTRLPAGLPNPGECAGRAPPAGDQPGPTC